MGAPWEERPDVWKDEKAYCVWLRGQCRRIWARHPIRVAVIQASRVPVTDTLRETFGLGARVKTACKCAICKGYFKQADVEVDHKDNAGSFTTVEEWKVWVDRLLLVDSTDLQVLCKECHSIVSYSQRMRCSFEEAKALKTVIAFGKLKVTAQVSILRKMAGLVEHPALKSAAKRIAFYAKLLGHEQLWANHLNRDRDKEWDKDE